ncbi:hypothetical protein Tco_0903316 [Tanacetum coccineum]
MWGRMALEHLSLACYHGATVIMSQEEYQQAARKEAWVPKADRVKISTTNMRIDPTMTHKEETYQVVLEIIKNTTFYKAFLVSADVPEIYMQQFWFTVTKIQKTNFYEFKLANKKCQFDVEVFRKALDICPRVQGKEFILPPSEKELLTFLIGLGYKGELTHLPQMFIDHMHQPWRTLASIINKCLSGKTTSNDRLRQSRVAIIWDVKFMPGSQIHTFSSTISIYSLRLVLKSTTLCLHTIRICNVDYAIKQSETYKSFINYSTSLVPPKKTRGKGSQGKKSNVTPKPVSVEVSNESDLDPFRRRTSSKRISKKKVSISADDNIIPELDVDLELGNSMSLTKAIEEDAARQVHPTHKWIVTKSDPEASGDLYDPLDQYAVSIKEDTTYMCMPFIKDHKGNEIQYAISRNDQYAVFKPYRNKIFWKISNVVSTPRNPQYAVSKTLDRPQLKKGKREIMPCPRFTKVIINHFLSIHKFVPKALPSGLHIITDDGVLSRMKFVRIGEDVQEYGRENPDAMLTDAIKQSENYKAFISYSIGLVPLKKTKGKGSQGKKSTITPKPTSVEVSDEFEPEPARRQNGEAAEEEAARQVHATREQIITESDLKLARRIPSGIALRDTSSVSKKISPDPSQKLKGIQTLTAKEQLAAATMQALKANSKSNRSQTHTVSSSEGTGVSPGVLDESTVIISTSSEGTGTKPGVPDEVIALLKLKLTLQLIRVQKKRVNILRKKPLMRKYNGTDNEFVHGDEYVHDNIDEEINDAKDDETEKDDEEITDAEKTEVTKVDLEQARKPPLTSSSLYVSSSFGNQFLNLSSDTSLFVIPEPTVLSPILKIPTVTLETTPPHPHSVSNITPILQQTTTPIRTPPITTETPLVTTVLDLLPTIAQRVSVLEKDVQELKQVDHSATILASVRSQVPLAVNEYLGSSLGDALHKALYTLKSLDRNSLRKKLRRSSFNKYPVHKALYHALIESLLADKEGMDQVVVNSLKKKRQHDDQDEDPSAGPNQGKNTKRRRTKEYESSKKSSTSKDTSKGNSPPKISKSDKSVHAKESVVKTSEEVNLDAATKNVVNDADQPQDDSK